MSLFPDTSTVNTQTQTQGWLQPYWQQYVKNMQGLTSSPVPVYNGPQVAPWNPGQSTALGLAYNQATQGTPAWNAAQSQIVNQAGNMPVNPYATQLNPYMGVDPYTQSVINNTNQNMTQAYQNGTAAQTDAAMAQQGAYGGSGYNELTALNNKAFGQALGSTDSQLLNQNYYNNAQLAQQAIQNATQGFQNQQQNALQGAGLGLQSMYGNIYGINNLANLSGGLNNYQQNVLNSGLNYFGQNVSAPFTTQQLYGNALAMPGGGVSTTTVPGPSPFGVAAGLFTLGNATNWFGLGGGG